MKEATCKHCGSKIFLIQTGYTDQSYKWVTDTKKKNTWHCGNDPKWPTKAHCPPESYFSEQPTN